MNFRSWPIDTTVSEGKTPAAAAPGEGSAAAHGLFDIFGPAVVSPVVIMLFLGSTSLTRLFLYALLHSSVTVAFPAVLWRLARTNPQRQESVETVWALAGSVVVAALPWVVAPEPTWSHYALGLIFAAITASDTLFMALRPNEPWRLMLGLPAASFTAYLAMVGAWPVAVFCIAFALHLGGGRDMVEQLVTRLREQRQRSEDLARTDPLTGLQNRRGLSIYVAEARELSDTLVVAAIDIDDFKQINDRLGHHGGDAALVQLAAHMRTALGESWLVARSGGDEFMCVSTSGTFDDARQCLRRVPSLLFEDTVMPLRVSVGLASGVPEESLLADASAALRLSKKRGKHRFTEVDADLRSELREARRLGAQLADAVHRAEIEVWAQPIVHLVGPQRGQIHSYECLARWATPDGVHVPPSTFIPMIEDQRLTAELGESIIERATQFLKTLPPHISVSVNVSASHFTSAGFVEFLHGALARNGLPPHRLTIEITETEDIPIDERSSGVARQLRKMGVGLAIDDFGTGYASLERLVEFPCSQIKLDRSIVNGASRHPGLEHLLAGFSKLSQESGIEVIAEGIEQEEQAQLLSGAGLPLAQGFLFGRPRPIAAIVTELATPDVPAPALGISQSG